MSDIGQILGDISYASLIASTNNLAFCLLLTWQRRSYHRDRHRGRLRRGSFLSSIKCSSNRILLGSWLSIREARQKENHREKRSEDQEAKFFHNSTDFTTQNP